MSARTSAAAVSPMRLKETGGTVDIVAVTLDPTEATRRVEAFMASHKNVDAMVLLGTTLVGPMLSCSTSAAWAASSRSACSTSRRKCSTAMTDGKILFGLDNQQVLMGYLPVAVLTAKAMYGTIPTADIITGPILVGKDTAASVKKLSEQGYR